TTARGVIEALRANEHGAALLQALEASATNNTDAIAILNAHKDALADIIKQAPTVGGRLDQMMLNNPDIVARLNLPPAEMQRLQPLIDALPQDDPRKTTFAQQMEATRQAMVTEAQEFTRLFDQSSTGPLETRRQALAQLELLVARQAGDRLRDWTRELDILRA